MKFIGPLLATFAVAFSAATRAADTGDEVIVVYNSRMPESKTVAEYYAQRRNVPRDQIFGFALTSNLDMTRAEFREALQKPLYKILEDRNLWHVSAALIRPTNGLPSRVEWLPRRTRIRYAVLCYGVPARIVPDPSLHEAVEEKMRPELRRNEAAVDSELALLPCLDNELPLAGPLNNPVYAATNAASFSPTNGVLMVTRLDGPSADIAKGLVDKAIQAETDGLWGRAYFDLRSITDPNYKPGDQWIRAAGEICNHIGFETTFDEKPETFPVDFPMSQIAVYCGWYDAAVSGPFTRPKVEFMPGAFAYHLYSGSGVNIRSPSEFWVGPLLAKGVTCTMGCVFEPYLTGTPELAIFVARFLYERMTFGEAAYASQPVLSWQTTFVGDPLYCPMRTPAEELHRRLTEHHSKLLEWSFLRLVNINLAAGKSPLVMAAFLEQQPASRESAVLTEKLADLYESVGKPSSAIDYYQRALKLNPSPEQRIRLRLTLGAKLEAQDQSADAYEDYLLLLRENPDYPNPLAIYQKLLPLAQKLGKTAETTKYQSLIRDLTPPPAAVTNHSG